ncbi:hypothetical protein Trco_008291 [Trichoderma cornu-damae]|uniref:Uncharacterized protein n=1 Tax=Trichoderma cornu-damae TaxID=654480 RepID=A0A9P8TRD3_9HYPO|nr:hypothetical protein Trco_008291 [Trichoderma cornu-damae]
MAPTYDDAPEIVRGHDLPEAYVSPSPEAVWPPQPSVASTYASQTPVSYGNPGIYANNGNAGTYDSNAGTYSDAGKGAAAAAAEESMMPQNRPAPTVGGVSLVLVLSVVIAILSAAVIGLAAGTGVAAKNYNDANSKLSVMSSSLAAFQDAASATGSPTPTDGTTPTPTDWSNLTNGCSTNPEDVTGLVYTSPFFASANFTMYCNKDTNNPPLYSVFATNFNGCMDACAGWNSHNTTTNGTCVAVSFIPLWSVASKAKAGNAPGDCYLKPGPQTSQDLKTPNIGTECHAAILLKSS